MDNSVRNVRIEMTMRAPDSQKRINYAVAVREYEVHSTMFIRRYCEKSLSREVFNLEQRQLFNDVQEDELLRYIDNLIDRFISLTT